MKRNRDARLLIVYTAILTLSACTRQPDPYFANVQVQPGPDTTFYQEASWSPDGTRLLLSRLDIHDAYRSSLAVVRTDGLEYRKLTNGPADMWASWSPDGERIVYGSEKGDNRDIYVMQADGSDLVRLTYDLAEDTHPHWSPDGEKIVFTSNRGGASHIYVMNANGAEQTQVSWSSEEKWNPRWSPDGSRIAYFGASEPGKDSVYVMDVDGTGRRALAAGVWPAWSPDGARLLFVRDRNLYQVEASGGMPRQVLDDAVIARWSPDGSRIAFVRRTWVADSGWPATTDVFVSKADGNEAFNVTRSAGGK